jgi:hypothetical protein
MYHLSSTTTSTKWMLVSMFYIAVVLSTIDSSCMALGLDSLSSLGTDFVTSEEFKEIMKLDQQSYNPISSVSNCGELPPQTSFSHVTEVCYPAMPKSNTISKELIGGEEIVESNCLLFLFFKKQPVAGKYSFLTLQVAPRLKEKFYMTEKEKNFYLSHDILKAYLDEMLRGEATYVNKLKCKLRKLDLARQDTLTLEELLKGYEVKLTQRQDLIELKLNFSVVMKSATDWLRDHPYYHETQSNGQSFTEDLYVTLAYHWENITSDVDLFNDVIVELPRQEEKQQEAQAPLQDWKMDLPPLDMPHTEMDNLLTKVDDRRDAKQAMTINNNQVVKIHPLIADLIFPHLRFIYFEYIRSNEANRKDIIANCLNPKPVATFASSNISTRGGKKRKRSKNMNTGGCSSINAIVDSSLQMLQTIVTTFKDVTTTTTV